ncbi:DUF3558 family protein [Streptomyces cadmiisoli]|uniref:DUF3558 family protein n=1 Tax=Streptomyces cadmiisoli TaxID=2184053 RepID=UPI00365CB03D
MQRRAQRADLEVPATPSRQCGTDRRARRTGRLNRALVCAAAVPTMLIAAGCSSDSGSGDDAKKASESASSATASPSPTVQAAAYSKLPEACQVLSKKTLGELVPKGSKSGKEGKSDDLSTRASCSWDSLDNNGVDGSQFRWLNVSMLRFESDAARGSGDELAREYYAKQVKDAQSATGARNAKTESLGGTGDQATAVRYDLKKKEGAFKQQTVVARVENVVVTVDYNGAGLAGDKTPDAGDLMKVAKKAAGEAVGSVSEANGGSDSGGSSDASKSPSKSAGSSESSAGKA